MRLTGERVRTFQWVALSLAVTGIAVIGAHTDADTTWLGLGLVLLAALGWSLGNMVGKQAGPVNMLAYVVWSSVFAVPPLLVLSYLTEGWPAIPGRTWCTVGRCCFGIVVLGNSTRSFQCTS
jgi:O-acetylserine/cysteine efflux transporter